MNVRGTDDADFKRSAVVVVIPNSLSRGGGDRDGDAGELALVLGRVVILDRSKA